MFEIDIEIENLLDLYHSGKNSACFNLLKKGKGNKDLIDDAIFELELKAKRDESANYLLEKLQDLLVIKDD